MQYGIRWGGGITAYRVRADVRWLEPRPQPLVDLREIISRIPYTPMTIYMNKGGDTMG